MTPRASVPSFPRRAYATAGLLVLVSAALVLSVAPFGAGPRTSTASTASQPTFDLYISNDAANATGQWLTPLDPGTLADLPGPRIELGDVPSFLAALNSGGKSMAWTASVDGSTLVGVEYARTDVEEQLAPDEVTIVVRDGLDGAERLRFHPPGPMQSWWPPLLSADGSRLVLRATSRRWYVFDTRGGDAPVTIDVPVPDGWGTFLDPAGRRLFLSGPSWTAPQPTQPAPLQIVAYDLATGREVGRAELPIVLVGSWQSQPGVGAQVFAGVALSPDGRQLAVVHPDLSALTLIDAGQMTVERTVALQRPTSVVDRLLGLLSFAPREAAAKISEGITLDAVFGPDGRQLYVTGFAFNPIGTGSQFASRRGLGVLRIDASTGTIAAEALPDSDVRNMLPTPDGRGLYVLDVPDTGGETIVLRLDTKTLEALARRVFDGFPWLALRVDGPA